MVNNAYCALADCQSAKGFHLDVHDSFTIFKNHTQVRSPLYLLGFLKCETIIKSWNIENSRQSGYKKETHENNDMGKKTEKKRKEKKKQVILR